MFWPFMAFGANIVWLQWEYQAQYWGEKRLNCI